MSNITSRRALIFGMQYDLVVRYKNCSNFAHSVKRSPKGSHWFYIGLYREIFKNLLVKMYKAYSLDIWYVASSSCPFTKFVQIMPLLTTAKVEISKHLNNI